MRVTRELYALAPCAALSFTPSPLPSVNYYFTERPRVETRRADPREADVSILRDTRPSCRWIYNGLLDGKKYSFCTPWRSLILLGAADSLEYHFHFTGEPRERHAGRRYVNIILKLLQHSELGGLLQSRYVSSFYRQTIKMKNNIFNFALWVFSEYSIKE